MNQSTSFNRHVALGALFAALGLAACLQGESEQHPIEGAIDETPDVVDSNTTESTDAETAAVDDTYPEPIAVLEPVPGYRVSFIELQGSDGFRGVGIAEEMPDGTPSLIDGIGLGEATPLEVYLAFTDASVEVPSSLVELYGEATFATRDRGSAVDETVEMVTRAGGDVACDDGSFGAWVNDSLPYDTWRLNQDGTQSGWNPYCDYSISAFGGCSGCINATRKKYEHTRYNADEWRAYSCLHSGGNHLWACSSGTGTLPLRVYYQYRDSNNNGWYNAYVSPASNYIGTNKTYSWHWYTGSNWDWKHTVRGAYTTGYDKVDLYTGWNQ